MQNGHHLVEGKAHQDPHYPRERRKRLQLMEKRMRMTYSLRNGEEGVPPRTIRWEKERRMI
jgi:hypothetical protein